ncbi:hypothetical protein [Arthrobacter psychrolactophilus]
MQLTAEGEALIDREFPHMLASDAQMLSGLTPREQAQLAALLRKLALTVESVS